MADEAANVAALEAKVAGLQAENAELQVRASPLRSVECHGRGAAGTRDCSCLIPSCGAP